MIFSRIILAYFFFIASSPLMAQVHSRAICSVDKAKILIGEPLTLTFEMDLPVNPSYSFKRLDSIPHFEMLEEPVFDSSVKNGRVIIKAIYTITSFDSGRWTIPAYKVGPRLSTDSFHIDVTYTDFDPNQDYHDIKDIILVQPKKKPKWWLYAIAGGLVLTAAIIYFLRKKKPAPVVRPAVSLNAYEEAMKELGQLQGSKTDAKMFHSGLTNIFRLYVYRKKGILSLQKTTDDLVLQLKNLDMDKDQFDKLAQSLRLSDFVKFAKYVPSAEDDSAAFETIRNSITTIEKAHAIQLA